jgi:hypothetical protein
MAPKTAANMTASKPKASRNLFPRGAHLTDHLKQAAKKDTGPLIRWLKEMNFAVALAAEHQKFPFGADQEMTTRWPAVFFIINRVFQRFPKFVQDYPQGFHDPNKMKSQFNDRDRPHARDPSKHAKSNWIFQRASCSTAEQQAMAAIATEVINTERVLSATKDSIVRDPGVNAIRWVEYDVKAVDSTDTKDTKRKLHSSGDAASDTPVKKARRRRAAQKPDEEEEEDEEDEEDEDEEEQEVQDEQASSSPAQRPHKGRRRADETRAEADLRYAAAAKAVRGGAASVQNAAEGSFFDEDEAEEGIQQHSSVPNAFDNVLATLNTGTDLQMVHASKVDFSADHAVIVVLETRPAAPLNAALDLSFDLNMFGESQDEDGDGEAAVPYHSAKFIELEDIFVSQTSQTYSLAGQVCRAEFRDEMTQRHAQADVMLCSPDTCDLCCAGEPSPVATSQAEQRPMVRVEDIIELEGNVWSFLPVGILNRRFESSYKTTDRVLEVVFTGGRRVKVEVFEEPTELTDPHFFHAGGSLSYPFKEGLDSVARGR